MFNLGFQEILIILVVALIFVGPKMLPDLASGLGKAIREVRKAAADIKGQLALDDAIRKPLEELREATMLPPEELKRRDEERAVERRARREEQERKDKAEEERKRLEAQERKQREAEIEAQKRVEREERERKEAEIRRVAVAQKQAEAAQQRAEAALASKAEDDRKAPEAKAVPTPQQATPVQASAALGKNEIPASPGAVVRGVTMIMNPPPDGNRPPLTPTPDVISLTPDPVPLPARLPLPPPPPPPPRLGSRLPSLSGADAKPRPTHPSSPHKKG